MFSREHTKEMSIIINLQITITFCSSNKSQPFSNIKITDKHILLGSNILISVYKRRKSLKLFLLSILTGLQSSTFCLIVQIKVLNLSLLEIKLISLCHQYRARPACISMQSDQALYRWLTNFKFHLDIP